MPRKENINKENDKGVCNSVSIYFVDALNHVVLQCLASLFLKRSKDLEATICSVSEYFSWHGLSISSEIISLCLLHIEDAK